VCGFACDSPAARRRPPQSTARPSARRAHTDRHTHTALDGDALSREIFFYVELDFVCPKKDAQGTVASSAHLRSAGPPLRPRARINRRPFRSAFASAGRAHTSCAAAALDARHQCTEARQADAVRAPHRARLHRPRATPHGPLGKHMPCSAGPSERGGTQRCLRDLDALAYRQPLAVAKFRWSPVSSFGYLCREERGAPWPPGRRAGGSVAADAPG
jgi:hypothetical protein